MEIALQSKMKAPGNSLVDKEIRVSRSSSGPNFFNYFFQDGQLALRYHVLHYRHHYHAYSHGLTRSARDARGTNLRLPAVFQTGHSVTTALPRGNNMGEPLLEKHSWCALRLAVCRCC